MLSSDAFFSFFFQQRKYSVLDIRKIVKLGLFFLLFVNVAWIAVPANTDLVWAAGERICKDDKVSAAL